MGTGVSTYQEFKRGDIVKHILSEEIYRVIKIHSVLTVCQCPPHHVKLTWQWTLHDRYICHVENLIHYPEGKVIFAWLDAVSPSIYTKLIQEEKPGTQLSLI
jgi:hypothetical protein